MYAKIFDLYSNPDLLIENRQIHTSYKMQSFKLEFLNLNDFMRNLVMNQYSHSYNDYHTYIIYNRFIYNKYTSFAEVELTNFIFSKFLNLTT